MGYSSRTMGLNAVYGPCIEELIPELHVVIVIKHEVFNFLFHELLHEQGARLWGHPFEHLVERGLVIVRRGLG